MIIPASPIPIHSGSLVLRETHQSVVAGVTNSWRSPPPCRAMPRRAMNAESAGQRPIGLEEFRSDWQRAAEGPAPLWMDSEMIGIDSNQQWGY